MILYFIGAIILAIITGITFSFSTKEHPVLFWLTWSPLIISFIMFSFWENIIILCIGITLTIMFAGYTNVKKVLEDYPSLN